MSIRIICFADLHVGVKTYGKIDPNTGLSTREIKTLETLDELINYAIDNEIKIIVAAGDMYKNSLPSPTLQDEFNKRIKRAASNGITCLILDGNHDVNKMDALASPIQPFSTLQIDNVIHTRFHKEYIYSDSDLNKIKFVFLPTYHTKEDIKSIINQTTYDGFPIVYIGHLTVKGALLNDWLIEDKEIYIDLDDFKKEGTAAVVLGHLHKHQILNHNPLIFYTGSTQRIDFNEEKQPKGFVVLDVEQNGDTDYQFIEVESQKFYTLKQKFVSEPKATEIIINELKSNKDKINNAIVRVQVDLDEETFLNEKDIYNCAYELGAYYVLNVQKFYEHNKNTRNSELTEHVSIAESLELYYKNKTRANERITLGKEIIKQISDKN